MTSITCGRHGGTLQHWRQNFKIKDFLQTTLSRRQSFGRVTALIAPRGCLLHGNLGG
jgi:hypothetical protein